MFDYEKFRSTSKKDAYLFLIFKKKIGYMQIIEIKKKIVTIIYKKFKIIL